MYTCLETPFRGLCCAFVLLARDSIPRNLENKIPKIMQEKQNGDNQNTIIAVQNRNARKA